MPLRSSAAPPLVGALCLAAALALAPAPAQAQFLPGSEDATPDSLVERLGLPEGHSPGGALRRSLMAPGWGQYYNRQYWKIPIAVAGFGAAVAALVYSWDRYYLYRNAWRYRRVGGTFLSAAEYEERFGEDGPTYYDGDKYAAAYDEVRSGLALPDGQDLPQGVMTRRQQFRRWREMAIIGVGIAWIFQVTDAYVSAHLLGFEVDDDLSMQVAPGREGLSVGLRLSL